MKIDISYRFNSGTPERKIVEGWSLKPDFKMSEDTEALNYKPTVYK